MGLTPWPCAVPCTKGALFGGFVVSAILNYQPKGELCQLERSCSMAVAQHKQRSAERAGASKHQMSVLGRYPDDASPRRTQARDSRSISAFGTRRPPSTRLASVGHSPSPERSAMKHLRRSAPAGAGQSAASADASRARIHPYPATEASLARSEPFPIESGRGDRRARAERGADPLSHTGEGAWRGWRDRARLSSQPLQHDRGRLSSRLSGAPDPRHQPANPWAGVVVSEVQPSRGGSPDLGLAAVGRPAAMIPPQAPPTYPDAQRAV